MFDVMKVRNDFPMIRHSDYVYFDSAATSYKPDVVIERVKHYYEFENVNVNRGDYDMSYQVSAEYDNVRKICARFLNAASYKEIVFTAGASSALNLVAYGYGQKFLKKGDIILTSEAEHASNILPLFKLTEVTGAKLEYVELNPDGSFNLENYKAKLNDKVKMVSFAHVSNVLGYILPMKEIAALAHQYHAVVVADGAQSVPHIKTDVQDLDVDFLCFSSHKMLGPAGVGVLYAKYALLEKMDPFMLGGGANARFDICGNILLKEPPYKFEAGTPCIEGVLGFGSALEYLMQLGMENIEAYSAGLEAYFRSKMQELDNVIIYNPHSSTAILTFNIRDIFAQDTAAYLNKHGFALRSGTHCAQILLNVIGASETVRASLYFYNTKEEIDRFIAVLKDITLEKCIEAAI